MNNMEVFEAEWLLRIVCSVVFGTLIGYERHSRSREAGVRTHALVAMTSCLLMLISMYAFADSAKNDPARIAAQVVSGIGFLGAGVIYFNNGSTHGITTAAGIWATSAIGLCFGAGMYRVALFAAFMMFMIQIFLRQIFPFVPRYSIMTIRVHLNEHGTAETVNKVLMDLDYNHSDNYINSDGQKGFYIKTQIATHRPVDPQELKKAFLKEETVLDFQIEQ